MPNRIDDHGFNRTRYQELRAEIAERFRATFGTAIKTDVRSVFGQLISILAYSEDRLAAAMQQLLDAFNPYAARGDALSRLATIMGTARTRGFPPDVMITITHNSAVTSINVDFTLADSQGLEYRPRSTITCSGTSTSAWFIAVRVTDYRAPAHTITRIVTPVPGVTAVDNPDRARKGQIFESDAKLRQRLLQTSSQNSSTVDGIRRVLSEVDGVTYAMVLHNPTGSTDANGLKPHSVLPIITGGYADDIAEALITKGVPAGIDYVRPGEIPTLTIESGTWRDVANIKTYTAWYTRVVYTEVQCNVSVEKLDGYDVAGHGAEIKGVIVDRMKEVNAVGKRVYASELYTMRLTNAKYFAIRDITLGPTASISATADFNERLTITRGNITISY